MEKTGPPGDPIHISVLLVLLLLLQSAFFFFFGNNFNIPHSSATFHCHFTEEENKKSECTKTLTKLLSLPRVSSLRGAGVLLLALPGESLPAGAPARRQADGGTRAAIISTGTATGKILPMASVPYRSIDNSEWNTGFLHWRKKLFLSWNTTFGNSPDLKPARAYSPPPS